MAAINNEVVNHAALFVQHQSVLPVSDVEPFHVVGQNGIQPALGSWSRHLNLAHVRNVKDPDVLTNSLVFIQDARIEDRHVPSAETDHFCAELYMFFEKGSLSEDRVG